MLCCTSGKGTTAAVGFGGTTGGAGFFSGDRDFLFSCEGPLAATGGAAVGNAAPLGWLERFVAGDVAPWRCSAFVGEDFRRS